MWIPNVDSQCELSSIFDRQQLTFGAVEEIAFRSERIVFQMCEISRGSFPVGSD